MLAVGLEPLEPYPGARPRWAFRCQRCGSEVRVPYYRIKGGRGCTACGRPRSNATKMNDPEQAAALMIVADVELLEAYLET